MMAGDRLSSVGSEDIQVDDGEIKAKSWKQEPSRA